jgi:hypothetical protein
MRAADRKEEAVRACREGARTDEPGKAAVAGFIALMITLVSVWIAFIAWAVLAFSSTAVLNGAAVVAILFGAFLIASAL